MSEPLADALFGVDGTEVPEPPTEPSERGASGLPPLTLPALPVPGMTREEIAAALGEDPTAQRSAAPPSAVQTDIPPVSASAIGAPAVAVPPVTAPLVAVTAPLSAHSAPQAGGPSAAGAPGHSPRPVAPMTVPPVPPTPGKSSGLRYRPPLAVGSRMIRQPDFRRRVGRRGSGVSSHPRSNGGATIFFLAAFVIAGVLATSIIIGIVDSIARLVP